MENKLKFILDVFGISNQFNKTLEELSELSTKIYHYKDNKCNVIELMDEIVDVDIMISQLKIYFDEEVIEEYKKAKIERTLKRIESGYYGVKDGK